MYFSSSLSLYLSLLLSFCWSGHVFSSLWSNVSKVKSLENCSLKVFSKCICHCLCICLCICFCSCLFVGQFMFSHDPHQFCEVSIRSGRPDGFESNTMKMNSQWVCKVSLELLGQLKKMILEEGKWWVDVSERGRIRVEPAVLPTGHLAYTGLRLRFKD